MTADAPGQAQRTGAFGVRHFGLVWLGGLAWNLSRWGVAFLGTYLINDLTVDCQDCHNIVDRALADVDADVVVGACRDLFGAEQCALLTAVEVIERDDPVAGCPDLTQLNGGARHGVV